MWGFYIHGAVDAISRNILGLKIGTTYKDPLIIANFYLNWVRSYNIAPIILRMDKGKVISTWKIFRFYLQIIQCISQKSANRSFLGFLKNVLLVVVENVFSTDVS